MSQAEQSIKQYQQVQKVTPEGSIEYLQATLNQLSLWLDVKEWLQITEDQLKKEDWVPTIQNELLTVRTAVRTASNSEWLKRGADLKDIDNKIDQPYDKSTSGKIVYSQINYAQSLVRIKNSSLPLGLTKPLWQTIDNHLRKAVEIAKVLKDRQAEAYSLTYRGYLFEKIDDSPEKQENLQLSCTKEHLICARDLTNEALKIIPDENGALEVSNPITDDQWQWQNVAYRANWQLGRIDKDPKNKLERYGSAVRILEAMRKDLRSTDSEVQFSFRDQVQPVYREYVSLLLQQNNLEEARRWIESLQLAELENFLACDLPITESADRLANQDRSAAIVYPIILPDRIEVVLSLPQAGQEERKLVHYKTEISSEEAELILKELRYWLEQPYISNRATELSKQVYGWIMKGDEPYKTTGEKYFQDLGIKTLLFISDGALRNIPMAALKDERYLIEDYAIAIAPRLQLLAAKPRKSRKAFIAGLTQVSPSEQDFSGLKYAKKEVETVQRILKESQSPLINQDFTQENLKKALASKDYNIVHLTTHGEFNFQSDKTFILTAKDRLYLTSKNKTSDTLETLFRENNNVLDLLVLSACETSTGDDRDTLGIAGMTVSTGARSAVASLWSIDELYTPKLMENFYAGSSLTKAQALQKAQIELLQDPDSKYPSTWAAYVLVGDWR